MALIFVDSDTVFFYHLGAGGEHSMKVKLNEFPLDTWKEVLKFTLTGTKVFSSSQQTISMINGKLIITTDHAAWSYKFFTAADDHKVLEEAIEKITALLSQ